MPFEIDIPVIRAIIETLPEADKAKILPPGNPEEPVETGRAVWVAVPVGSPPNGWKTTVKMLVHEDGHGPGCRCVPSPRVLTSAFAVRLKFTPTEPVVCDLLLAEDDGGNPVYLFLNDPSDRTKVRNLNGPRRWYRFTVDRILALP